MGIRTVRRRKHGNADVGWRPLSASPPHGGCTCRSGFAAGFVKLGSGVLFLAKFIIFAGFAADRAGRGSGGMLLERLPGIAGMNKNNTII